MKCANCQKTYKSHGCLLNHIKKCKNMVYNEPLTTTCRELTYEAETNTFEDDVATDVDPPISVPDPEPSHSAPSLPMTSAESTPTKNVRFSHDGNSNVMVAYLVNEENQFDEENQLDEENQSNNLNNSDPAISEEHLPVLEAESKKNLSPTKRRSKRASHPTKKCINKALLERLRISKLKTKTKNKSRGRPAKKYITKKKSSEEDELITPDIKEEDDSLEVKDEVPVVEVPLPHACNDCNCRFAVRTRSPAVFYITI